MRVFDQGSQPDLPLPEHVPEELVQRYGAKARRTVRGSRTWRHPFALRYRRVRHLLKDRDLWVLTLVVFTWSVVAAAAVGALIYATMMFPWAFWFVVVPVIVLFGLAFGAALRVTRRRETGTQV